MKGSGTGQFQMQPGAGYLLGATKQSGIGSCLCWAYMHITEAMLQTTNMEPGEGHQRPKAPQDLQNLLDDCQSQTLKEFWEVCELDDVGPQGVIRVGQVAFTQLIQIQIWCRC